MKLFPYLIFNGNCEDAMNFYQSVFGGSINVMKRYSDAPMDIPEHYKNKIMHGELHFADNILAACDAFPWKEVKNDTGVQLCINYSDDAEAAAVFKKLAAGGKISMSFEKQFWNSSLGKLTDKFEKIWMIASEAV